MTKCSFEFPDFKLEMDEPITKERWEKIKRIVDAYFEVEK